jgi:hypothetical protein
MSAFIVAVGSGLTIFVAAFVFIGCLDGWRVARVVTGMMLGLVAGLAAILLFWIWVGSLLAGGAS